MLYSISLIDLDSFKSTGVLTSCDYFINDGEYNGAVLRFMRSLKIAAQISLDYNIGLYNLDEEKNPDEYNKVSFKFAIS